MNAAPKNRLHKPQQARKAATSSPNSNEGGPGFSGYFFKVPDELECLMGLHEAELKAFLVVQRSIQRDSRPGEISARQLARRIGVTDGYACEVLGRLCDLGLISAQKAAGKTTVYSSPFEWKQPAGRSTPVEHLTDRPFDSSRTPKTDYLTPAEHPCSTGVEHPCSTPVERHLEHIESSEKSMHASPPDGGPAAVLSEEHTQSNFVDKPSLEKATAPPPRSAAPPPRDLAAMRALKSAIASTTKSPVLPNVLPELVDLAEKLGGDIAALIEFAKKLANERREFQHAGVYLKKLIPEDFPGFLKERRLGGSERTLATMSGSTETAAGTDHHGDTFEQWARRIGEAPYLTLPDGTQALNPDLSERFLKEASRSAQETPECAQEPSDATMEQITGPVVFQPGPAPKCPRCNDHGRYYTGRRGRSIICGCPVGELIQASARQGSGTAQRATASITECVA